MIIVDNSLIFENEVRAIRVEKDRIVIVLENYNIEKKLDIQMDEADIQAFLISLALHFKAHGFVNINKEIERLELVTQNRKHKK